MKRRIDEFYSSVWKRRNGPFYTKPNSRRSRGKEMNKLSILIAAAVLGLMAFSGVTVLAASVWQIQTVQDDGMWSHTSLALDTSGRPHIAYFYAETKLVLYVKYAYQEGSSWHTETVEEITMADNFISLALDTSGRPHIAYYGVDGMGNYELKYAYHDGSMWQIQTVVTILSSCKVSLALDTAGHPRLSYDNNGLKYAYHDGSTWQIQTVDASGSGGSLALDKSDRPHISYSGTGGLAYAYHDGSTWQIQTVDSSGGSGSLALDTAGRPYISYSGNDGLLWYGLKYAYHDGSTWQIQRLESNGGSGSLALDTAGRPHISYHGIDGLKYVLKYAYYNGSTWYIETVDKTLEDDWSGTISFVLDAADRPHISYPLGSGTKLKYARRNSPINETCAYVVASPKLAKYKGGVLSLKISTSADSCAAPEVSITADWITNPATVSFSGNKGTVKLTIPPNPTASERSAEITVGGTPVTVTQQPAPCKLSAFTPKKGVLPSSGDASSFSFAIPEGCGWTAALDEKGATWLTLGTASGDGSGVIDYSAAANATGKPLSGKIVVTVIPTGKAKKYSVKQEK